jgi:crotonobetainyl-CoA:carnitine CoA-transferase CaiB-like acyl-CoA transferase
MFLEWNDPVAGPVKGAGVMPRLSETPGGVWRGAPWLGQDNDAVLSEVLGYSAEDIDRLRKDGVIGADPPVAAAPGTEVPFFRREGL